MEQNEPAIVEPKLSKTERRCAQTRQIKDISQMVRFVANDIGEVFPDVSARAPGRGVWISACGEILAQAIKSNAFSKSLKRSIHPKAELIDLTRDALMQKAIGFIGLAKRAGQLVLGFDQVSDYLRKSAPAFVIEACDGSNDGRDKILYLSQKWDDVKIIGCFSSDDLGKVLGRDNIIHALMPKGQFAQNWNLEIERLKGFVPLKPQEWNF